MSPGPDLSLGVVLRFVDIGLDLVKALFIDDGVDEIGEIFHRTRLKTIDALYQFLLNDGGQRIRDIGPGSGSAFLALVFESAAQQGRSHYIRGSAFMGPHETLPPLPPHYSGA